MQKVESRQKMLELVEKERKRLEKRKQKIHEIITSNGYILWLEKFTQKYTQFRDEDFLYNIYKNKDITKEDLENMDYLGLLFEGIYEYAENNYIFPISDSNYTSFYKIKYNNIGYEIGSISGQITQFYCKRVNGNIDNFIDFNDIILNKKQPNTDYFNKRLLQLSNIIHYYYEQGIPLNSIDKVMNEAIWNIRDNERNKIFEKEKTLRKK